MKSKQRHQLKQNGFAETAAATLRLLNRYRTRAAVGGVVVIVLLAIVGGTLYWRNMQANHAGALLGVAMATEQAQIAPPPSLPGAKQTPGTYPTEKARNEAALKAFNEIVAQYPDTDAATLAGYEAASLQLSLGQPAAAAAAFKQVADATGDGFYGPLARLGEAEALMAEGKQDEALTLYTQLAANRDGALPVDGLLMQLAGASLKAGKTQDARAAFKRVVDEFPESGYATDAKQQLAALN